MSRKDKQGSKTSSNVALDRRSILLGGTTLAAISAMASGAAVAPAQAQPKQPAPTGQRPNILVIFGDDVGYWNLSAYNQGMMGYKTPNIDRIAREGALFTDYYGQQSCTAGRSAFITGQSPFRTGLLKVGLPGAALGLQKEDPTIADLLKSQGYMTFQHGKNHLGDRNEYLPTVHGFDEFFGNLYHLNAEQEPENVDYPKDPAFLKRFGPRGVLKTRATDKDDATVDPRFGRVGMQTIEDTGPLNIKRMETADEEFLAATLDAMERSTKAKRPFFIWHNTTRMHIWTHLQKKYQDMVAEKGLYGAGMTELDDHVGVLLKKLEDLAIANNTIVIFTSDNGAETFTWPDGGCTPFRGEKNTNWEGGYRVPCMVRWPGTIKPGTVVNDVVSHEDWAPTLMAAAGDPDVKSKLMKGLEANGKTFKVHLDGYNQTEAFSKGESARREFFYFTDDGDLCGLRVNKWKAVFMEQTHHGFNVWRQPMITLRIPKIFDLRADPFERADHESGAYDRWLIDRVYALTPAQVVVGQFLSTFKEYPPRQRAATFGVSQALDALHRGSGAR